MAWLDSLSPHWAWLIVAAVLATAEILVPGFFLIWFALAAFATGIVALLLPIPVTLQLALFAGFAVASVYAGRRWFQKNPIVSADPLLNDRAGRMVGQIVTVVEPIETGGGRVKVGDSVWSASGPDAPSGTRMRIAAVEGNTVVVEPV